ncbi:MAG: lipid-A-disaccharide synthase [Xenococcus sp. MO_188.B8]|nr:lipid-A-disaccharide synthase [Xenococcus sp. MO_188.B8]
MTDIVILSNGPGEVTTWVRPVVKALRQELGSDKEQTRISVILSPCPHSTGKEAAIALSYPEVDRVQDAEYFTQFLLWGKTADNWDWHNQGVVIFLGGDQFFTLLIGKRLGYRTVVYAEWDARWYRWLDHFAVMKPEVIAKVPQQFHHRFTVVGDLMADVVLEASGAGENEEDQGDKEGGEDLVVGFLPGSKSAKLMQGVPLCLAIADYLKTLKPNIKFIIPVAPTLELDALGSFANPEQNSLITKLGWVSGELISTNTEQEIPYLLTSGGTKVDLLTEFPAYNSLLKCQLCVTTVGANTAELGSLAIPMLVLLPTQQLDAMRSWDGIPGILANLPLIGSVFAKLINWLVLRQKRLFAWPNIWAKSEIVPELVGNLDPKEIAEKIVNYLENPEELTQIRDRLIAVRGNRGASQKIASIVKKMTK